jgi:hypothetical protein
MIGHDAYVQQIANEFGITKAALVERITQGALEPRTRHFADGSQEIEVILNRETLKQNITKLMQEIHDHKTGKLFPLR